MDALQHAIIAAQSVEQHKGLPGDNQQRETVVRRTFGVSKLCAVRKRLAVVRWRNPAVRLRGARAKRKFRPVRFLHARMYLKLRRNFILGV